MGILIIIVWPLSKVLDCLLGEEHGTFYRRAELKVLVDLHGKNHQVSRAQSSDGADDCLTVDEIMIIKVNIILFIFYSALLYDNCFQVPSDFFVFSVCPGSAYRCNLHTFLTSFLSSC